jgi:capsular exopolysaccharide synthesis family protein
MSQDLVRSNGNRNGYANDPYGGSNLALSTDPWGNPAGGGGALARPAGAETQALQTLHRSLRGRYHWALVLGVAGALIGAAAGWAAFDQKWRAVGNVRIDPQVQGLSKNSDTQSLYGQYMNAEALRIKSGDVIARAIQSPDWKDVAQKKGISDGAARGIMSGGLTTMYLAQSYNIEVRMEAGDPEVAKAAAASLINAYIDVRKQAIRDSGDSTLENLRAKIDSLETEIASKTAVQSINTKLTSEIDSKRGLLNNLEGKYSTEELMLASMVEMKSQVEAQLKVNPEMVSDDYLKGLVAQRRTQDSTLSALRLQLGVSHPKVRQAELALASLDKEITAYQEKLKQTGVPSVPVPGGGAVPVDAGSIERQTKYVALIKTRMEELRKEVESLESQRAANEAGTARIPTIQRQLDEARGVYENALMVVWGKQLSATPGVPTGASVSEDKRATMATFGFVVGGALPVLAVFVWGLADRKYRYSDETTEGGTKGIPLLGILPDLPDRLSDPSQASVAAHCVHQIRTMLQLNVISAEEPTILCVTSATSGDGKTSLTLALGLSFAASGSRTLLIDTDIIGAGLSARLGIREQVGITEAITDRSAAPYIKQTDVADLSILPVGIGPNQQAGVFTPAAVRRLLNEVRKSYDIILVDTGPVLGSIEATPLVAAADATILTVAKGQNRDFVEKAIAHLRQIGARIAGVVFNRAAARDFERSISGISLRSVSRQQQSPHYSNGHADKPNPVVSAVSGR